MLKHMRLDDWREALYRQGNAGGVLPTCEVDRAGAVLQGAENCATKICHQAPSHGRAVAFKVSLEKKIIFFSNQKYAIMLHFTILKLWLLLIMVECINMK